MSAFQFSILPLLDKFDTELLKNYKDIGVNEIHYDVIDNDFYKGRGYNGEWIDEINEIGLKINVHIMAQNVGDIFKKIAKKKVASISFQVEPFSTVQVLTNLKKISQIASSVGIAVEFETPIEKLEKIIFEKINFITFMSVKPGRGGQKFDELSINNLQKIKKIIFERKKNIFIHLDGGVNKLVVEKTKTLVDSYVSGNYFFKLTQTEKKDFLHLIERA